MRLTFHSTFASIKEFPNIELPNLVVLTGLNGTGKSHVLKAIKAGKIGNDLTSDYEHQIRFYDWTNLMPPDRPAYDGRDWMNHRRQAFENVQGIVRQHESEILDAAKKSGLSFEHLVDAQYVASLSLDDLTRIFGDAVKAKTAAAEISNAAVSVENKIKSKLGNNQNIRAAIETIKKLTGRPLVTLSSGDFYLDSEDRWGQVDLFQQNLGQLFVAYRDTRLNNKLKQYAQNQDQEIHALTDMQFLEKYKRPPWDFVNDTLKTAKLDFEIDHPDLFDYIPYHPKLKKISTGARIYFSELSSGEKVLMSLALCLYYTQDTRQISSYPKILLLDEIDAPLHPSMSKLYLEVLKKNIVTENNIPVIAVTHSPSTVAMAPEGALYVIEPGKPGLQKTSKARALNILTDAVPTLAISFDGRRQVFVESPNDAELYDTVNQIFKSKIISERSLQFIATGTKNKITGDHSNTGCELVRHLVDSLSQNGNISVFGLIDWDGINVGNARTIVLAEGLRNGLENVILDPLLLATTIVATERSSITKIGLSTSINYPSFLEFSSSQLQPVVDQLQGRVLKRPVASTVKCHYVGGFGLDIDKDYLTIDDHELETAVLEAFPALKAFSKGRAGALLLHVANSAIRDKPDFVPIELHDVLVKLLTQPYH